MNEAGEVYGATVVSRGEATEVLEAVEAALDPVAMFVVAGIVRDGDLAESARGNDGLNPDIGDDRA